MSRLSNVMEPRDFARFHSFDADARISQVNLCAYLDARDAAPAIRLAIEAQSSAKQGNHPGLCVRHLTSYSVFRYSMTAVRSASVKPSPKR